ncbi:MAG: DoxX family protein [Candidatus Binatia bacterium]
MPHAELQAPFVAGVEFVYGALVLIGLFTRVASVPLIVTMIVALVTAQKENVGSVGDLFGLIEWSYLVLLVWLGVAGPGPLSLDALRGAVGDAPRVSPALDPAVSRPTVDA